MDKQTNTPAGTKSSDITHEKENKRFSMAVNGESAYIDYSSRNGKLYLTYSEVPYALRGHGIGKELVEKTFEKLTEEGHTAVAVCPFIKKVAEQSEKWSRIIG